MKILQVNKLYYPWIGGVETIVQEIAEWLNGKDEFEIDVLVLYVDPSSTIISSKSLNV
jgi:hypothetical protein